MNAEAANDPSRKHRSSSESPFPVRVRLLGGFGVWVGPRVVAEGAWHLRKAKSLMKLLALAPGHALHREQLMELLWPELGKRAATNNLRGSLHAARRALTPDLVTASCYLASKEKRIALCSDVELWVDVEAFEEATRSARRSFEPSAYEAALDLYAGDLLPEDRYEEWTEKCRGQLKSTYLALLVELAGIHEERSDHDSAAEALGKVVAEEPTNEEAHTGLMRVYALSGNKGEALAQYVELEEILLRELGTEPAASSRALREEIAAGSFPLQQASSFGSPPDKLPDAGKHNLPAPRTSFVGRERELVEVKRALAMTRLLTLTGAGGSGKTRLALEVTRDLVASYPDGVWFVELAPLAEGELVPQAVTQTVGVREQPGRSLTDTLVNALRTKNTLLVLDNCEHLVESVAPLLDTLLNSCPRLRVLATSRETLQVEGEILWRVSSLSVPDTDRLPVAGEMTHYDAVRLFLDRARSRLPNFDLTPNNTEAIAEVCQKLEGMPLAIELATARVGTISVRQLSERLRDPLGLLSGGGRTAGSRQQTLRGALDWSYELLSEPEQLLFGRLSVFAGGWTLEAAEAVGSTDGIEEAEALDLLSELVNKSLVVSDSSRDDAQRYRILEPVRQYAQERLEESGEAETIRNRHAGFFLTLAERAELELQGESQGEWFQRLEQEHDNLRAALGSLYSQGEVELGLRLAAALWEFWYMHGHLSEGRGRLERGISASGITMVSTRARALNGAGWIALFQGDYESARALVEESLTLYRGLESKEGIASALANLGFVAVLGQHDQMCLAALLEESIELRPEVRNPRTVANLLAFEALVGASQFVAEGRFAEYAARFRTLQKQSIAIFREKGDVLGIGHCLINLAICELVLANYDQATTLLRELWHQSQKVDDKLATQYVFFGLAVVAASQGHLIRAARLWAVADTVREIFGIELTALARFATDYEGRLAEVRAKLGEEALEEAWEEGRTMTIEEASKYAFSENEPTTVEWPVPEQLSASTQATTLTRREREVANLLERRFTSRQIASELHISEHTVDKHVANILRKLNLHSREQVAVQMAKQRSHLF
jgi:predicted ATPase/DNA-binding SARP family transcriptional activator/DNA-binding CsgD family transcriptional regulator